MTVVDYLYSTAEKFNIQWKKRELNCYAAREYEEKLFGLAGGYHQLSACCLFTCSNQAI